MLFEFYSKFAVMSNIFRSNAQNILIIITLSAFKDITRINVFNIWHKAISIPKFLFKVQKRKS